MRLISSTAGVAIDFKSQMVKVDSMGIANRVYWTARELRLITEQLIVQGTDNPEDVSRFLKGVREAQKVLPAERHRNNITGMHHVQGVKTFLRDYQRLQAASQKIAEPPEAVPEGIQADVECQNEVQEVNDTPPFMASIDTLLEVLAATMAERFIYHLKISLNTVTEREVAQYLTKPTPKGGKLRRVLVVGLKPQQAGMIQAEFGNTLDLKFIESGGSAATVQDRVGAVDSVIVTKFSGHDQWNSLKKQGISPTFVSGGISALRSTLNTLR